jgi:hypothetical protein
VIGQSSLLRSVLSSVALGIENEHAVQTPTTSIPLTKDSDGEPPDCSFSYQSEIGLLGYLQSNSRPDITYAVSSAARFTHNPKRSYEEALKRIGRYFKSTMDEFLILRPSDIMDIDCYVDADFAGLWPHENKMDPSGVKPRTGSQFVSRIVQLLGVPNSRKILLLQLWRRITLCYQ